MKIFLYLLLGISILFVIWILNFVFGIFSMPFHSAANLIKTQHDITDKTINADNVIYNYEYFKQAYEDIKATQTKIINSNEELTSFENSVGKRSEWTFEDKTEDSRLRTVVLGLKNHLEDQTAEYNARSKMANRVIFKDGLIPDTLEIGKNILTNFHLGK